MSSCKNTESLSITSHISDEQSAPVISVILPVCNGAGFLAQAVESILSQTYRDFELLALDDGSTDNSRAILENFAAADCRVRVISRENRGLVATLNEGIELAKGGYIARMDADDICLPDRFALQMAYMQEHPDCVLLGTSYTVIDADGRPIFDIKVPQDHDAIEKDHLRGVTRIGHPTAMMRRDAAKENGGYDPQMIVAQDLDLWLRMAETGRIANLGEICLQYRVHDKSIGSSKRDLQRECAFRACEAARVRRGMSFGAFDYKGRPTEDTHEARSETFLRYGWQAWSHGYRRTWRHYAIRSIRLTPFSIKAWKLLIAGATKRPKVAVKGKERIML